MTAIWKNEIKENYAEISKYNYLGIRATCEDEDYKVGDICRNSLDWDYEDDCSSENELPGACAIIINNYWIEDADDLINRIDTALSTLQETYTGKQIILIGGNNGQIGDDDGEIVIGNAMTLAIIK
jgi:hypothetical protein